MKIWIWSALGLLVINSVIVGIVAFLIHRDSVQYNNEQITKQTNAVPTSQFSPVRPLKG